MMMFSKITEAISWIESRPRFRPKTSLVHIKNGYEMLGINLNCKKVHIAGTNGKGSTASYLSYLAYESKMKVGTFTSPYLLRFNERIRINMDQISDKDLLIYINYIYKASLEYQELFNDSLSFFELLTLMAFKYFSDNKVDIIVVEAGIGGLFDATNILDYDVSIITNIGFDHMKQLGNSLEEIATNKLGIVKPNGYLISTVRKELVDLFKSYCDDVGAVFKWINKDEIKTVVNNPHVICYLNNLYQLNLIGEYQNQNAALAIEAIKHINPLISDYTIKQGFLKAKWEGRMEEVSKNIYIDGAHNVHAIEGLVGIIGDDFKNRGVYIIFSCLADKEPLKMIKMLKPFVNKIVLTSFNDPRFTSLSEFSDDKMPYIEDFRKALEYVRGELKDDDIIIITGSIHFIGAIRHLIK